MLTHDQSKPIINIPSFAHWVITASLNGSGVDHDELDRIEIFQPYFDDEHAFDGKSMNVHVCVHDSPLSDFREILKISKN
jgi:hypothetical protein